MRCHRDKTYKSHVHPGSLNRPARTLQQHQKQEPLLPDDGQNTLEKRISLPPLHVCVYLLVKKGPEHWQRDVQQQHPQHHLDLLDQTLLLGCRSTDAEPEQSKTGELSLPSTVPRPSPTSASCPGRALTSASGF